MNDITSQNGTLIPKMKLREMFLSGEIPFMTALVVQTDHGEIKVPINAIDNINVEPSIVNNNRPPPSSFSGNEFPSGPAK